MQGSHALGHTRMATESAVTTDGSHPFSTGLDLCLVHNGSLSNHNRPAPLAARGGHRVPDRQRLRGRRRLPDLAHARGRDARAGARGLPRRPRRLLHVRGRHGRRLRGAARPDRLQAGGDGRDRRAGWRWPPSTARSRCCRAPTTRHDVGARARAASTAGNGRRSREAATATSRSGSDPAARAERRAARDRTPEPPLARAQPARRARARRRASTRRSRSRSTATSATTAPA